VHNEIILVNRIKQAVTKILYFPTSDIDEPGSSVNIVSGYGLDDRAIEVRSPAEAKDFSSNLCPDRL
jgi:hypothetical protein